MSQSPSSRRPVLRALLAGAAISTLSFPSFTLAKSPKRRVTVHEEEIDPDRYRSNPQTQTFINELVGQYNFDRASLDALFAGTAYSATVARLILPPATLGMLGGGQLGRFFVSAAHEMGYQVWVLDPDKNSPAGQIAERHFCVDYNDYAALDEFAAGCAAITTEFENVPAASLDFLARTTFVAPAGRCVAVAQDRIAEKRFIEASGVPVAPHVVIESPAALAAIETAAADTLRLYPDPTAAELRATIAANRAFASSSE